MKLADLSGKKIHEWKVLERDFDSVSATKWLCECSCGNKVSVHAANLKYDRSKSCVNCRYKNRRQGINGAYWSRLKCAAKSRGLEVEITKEFAYELLVAQNFRCALSGEEIKMTSECREFTKSGATASLDRIDSSKGYVQGNVQWLHKDVNMMKNKLKQTSFVDLCKKVAERNEN